MLGFVAGVAVENARRRARENNNEEEEQEEGEEGEEEENEESDENENAGTNIGRFLDLFTEIDIVSNYKRFP